MRRIATALALCVIVGDRALAQSHEMMMHHGVPSRVVANQRVGPYVASLWIEPEVGDGTVYVMLDAANGVSFIPPSTVRVAATPSSGRIDEVVHEAHFAPLRAGSGARYMTKLMFDRPELWNVRVIVEGPGGGGQFVTQVESAANAAMGLFGVSLASTPFLLVGFVYWRSAIARRRTTAVSA